MRETSILALTLALYIAMAVFMAGIVKAYFADDDVISTPGAFSYARSYVSGNIYSGKVHDPFYRSSGWNTTAITWGSLYIEYKWYGDA